MKKVFNNIKSLDQELERLKSAQEEINFLKKQHLAYQLCQFMQKSNLSEAMMVGEVSEGDSTDRMPMGAYFDGKTTNENHYVGSLVQIEEGEYLEQSIYVNRYQNHAGFEDLRGIKNVFEGVFYGNENLKSSVFNAMQGRPFGRELRSIMQCVMTPPEYTGWSILIEQQELQSVVGEKMQQTIKSPREISAISSRNLDPAILTQESDKKILSSPEEALIEIVQIEKREKNDIFSKKQHLAYQLCEVMKSTYFTEMKFIGYIDREKDFFIIHGPCFDAKTKSQGYTNLSFDGYATYTSTPMRHYVARRSEKENSEFEKLEVFHRIFIHNANRLPPEVRDELYENMKGVSFTADVQSILKLVMNESEYAEWKILNEQKNLTLELLDKTVQNKSTRSNKI